MKTKVHELNFAIPESVRCRRRVFLLSKTNPWSAWIWNSIVLAVMAAEVVRGAPRFRRARQAMAAALDFAFLDIEVTDGKTFEIARELRRRFGAPFVFVSGARPDRPPPDLRSAPFISKPFNSASVSGFCVERSRGLCERVEIATCE